MGGRGGASEAETGSGAAMGIGAGAGGVAGPGATGRSPGEDPIVGRSGEPGLVAEMIWLGLAAPGTW